MKRKVADIKFRDDLYPRIEKSPTTVQKYAEDLTVLPPIEINQLDELIDGWHRWTAHEKKGVAEIEVVVTETASDAELLELAIERNAKGGLSLSMSDKSTMARKIYHGTPMKDRGAKKQRLRDILSVSLAKIQKWLARIDKDDKEEREVAIVNLWLECKTQEEIADAVGMSQQAVARVLQLIPELRMVVKLHHLLKDDAGEERSDEDRAELILAENSGNAGHTLEFEVPLYNIWKQQEKTEGNDHPGNSEVRWVDNLLKMYTKPFDIVIDPFAGSGSTLDICKKRWRRCLLSDRKPITERRDEIAEHDIADGPLKPPQWKDVKLVYLDPPYWKQAAGKYSTDKEDLANMDLVAFTKMMAKLIKAYALKVDGYIALIIGPTQYSAEDHKYTDHLLHLVSSVKLPVALRFSVPYESQQYGAVHVEWAKKENTVLVLTREVIVWKTKGKVDGVYV